MSKPFWEETYQDMNVSTFGSNPNKTIVQYEDRFNKEGYVLDVGCGEGQNSLYLAKKGFRHMEAFDLSENAIAKMRILADIEKINLNAWTSDLCTYQFEKNYDLIMSFGTLHFVSKEDWHRFIMNAKEHTNIGGYHVIQLFTNTVPASSDIAPYAIGLANDTEIKELYSDWEIIEFQSYTFEDEHPNVPKHLHASNKIVVRKQK